MKDLTLFFAKLEKDIGWEKGTIEKLKKMMKEYKDGQSWSDYGLAPDADSKGSRSPDFATRSQTYQNLVNDMEDSWTQTMSDKWTRAKATPFVGWMRASMLVETNRSENILSGMESIFAAKCKCPCDKKK